MSGISTYTSEYTIFRGDFGLANEVWAGEYNLATYHYTNDYTNDRKYNLSALDYGNNDRVEYTYDNKDRLTEETFEDGDTVTYAYNNDGDLAVVTDSATGITTKYYYDLIGRLVKQEETGGNRNYSVQYTYDSLNNLESLKETINGTDHTSNYEYDAYNRVDSVTNGTVSENYTYDSFSRVQQSVTKNGNTNVLTESYTFTAPSANATSGQIATNRLQATGYDVTYSYTYDDNGNILSISDGTNTTSYVYDSANQLIRENNQAGGFTHTWEYDHGGNILNRKEYAYTTGTLGTPLGTVTYTYDDENLWGDRLYSYDGQSIELDEIGNTLSDGTWTYTWEHGRELATMSNGAATWSFTYDANGMRTKRSNGSTTYQYIYNGSSLSQMTVNSNITLYFAYGANGVPMSVVYNNTTYYYVTNIQGDVIAILNAAGIPVVHYSYDAWGNPISTTGSMASTLGAYNPLRYRGYVFDQETQLYYLQSRYYNPEWGRFINADAFVSTGQGLLGYNMFAYCNNNPILLKDSLGTRPVLSTSLQNETKKEKAASFAYMRELASRNALRMFPRSLEYTGSNTSTYSGESDASVIARMLYGEDHNSIEAHLWVLENRRIAGNYIGGTEYRSLILGINQFDAMPKQRALAPASQFTKVGEKAAWEKCVDMAYRFIDGGIASIPKPFDGFNYTYTHSYSDAFAKAHPHGVHISGTWFYNK